MTKLAVGLAWGILCFNKDLFLVQILKTSTEVAYLPSTLNSHFEIKTIEDRTSKGATWQMARQLFLFGILYFLASFERVIHSQSDD